MQSVNPVNLDHGVFPVAGDDGTCINPWAHRQGLLVAFDDLWGNSLGLTGFDGLGAARQDEEE